MDITARDQSIKAGSGLSIGEALIGVLAVVLTIIGLFGFEPNILLALATISVGAGFLIEGGAISERQKAARSENAYYSHGAVGGGITTEMIAGVAGIVLGIIGLIGIWDFYITSIAAIIYGFTLFITSGIDNQLLASISRGQLPREAANDKISDTEKAVRSNSVLKMIIGAGVTILGLIAAFGYSPQEVTLVAMLATGVALLFTGSVVGSRLTALLKSVK
jgi:hypothetical protein